MTAAHLAASRTREQQEEFQLNRRTGCPRHQVVKDRREAWSGCRAFSTGGGQSWAGDGPKQPVLMLPCVELGFD